MKILYGVQGTGNGHIARTRALLPYLRRTDIEIDCVFSGRKKENYFDMDEFGEYKVFTGLTFVTENGKLNPLQTVKQNNFLELIKNIRSLDLKTYDLVISDFEPITAWAAKIKGCPSISLSHQSAFFYDVPKVGGNFISKFIMRIFSPGDYKLGFHYHHFNQPVLPPLIRKVRPAQHSNDKIVVYMGFESIEEIIELLKPFKEIQFEIFANTKFQQKLHNITINPISVEKFHHELKYCKGVIANAGFELSSECLMYGKKMLLKPLTGQYEQLCNLKALKKLNKATIMTSLDKQVIKSWLEQPEEKPIAFPETAEYVANWIIDPKRCSVEELSRKVWSQIS